MLSWPDISVLARMPNLVLFSLAALAVLSLLMRSSTGALAGAGMMAGLTLTAPALVQVWIGRQVMKQIEGVVAGSVVGLIAVIQDGTD